MGHPLRSSSTAGCSWPSAAGEIVGFLVASPVPLRKGWLIEQIIRGRAAPNGTTELLLDTAIYALAERGARVRHPRPLPPVAGRAAGAAADLERPPAARLGPRPRPPLLRLRGVRGRFKRKFNPESWEPIYAVTDRPRISLRTLYAIAGAFGGTSPVLFVGRALLRALGQEARWAVAKGRRRRRGVGGGPDRLLFPRQ